MGGKMSREKGKRGEREFASFCKAQGYDARRGQQFNGIDGEDVVGLPGIHVEVKRTERLNVYEAMEQAWKDSHGKDSIVAHRRNDHRWLVIMDADEWFKLYREYEASMAMANK